MQIIDRGSGPPLDGNLENARRVGVCGAEFDKHEPVLVLAADRLQLQVVSAQVAVVRRLDDRLGEPGQRPVQLLRNLREDAAEAIGFVGRCGNGAAPGL